MPDKGILVDHRSLFRSFLFVLLVYALLWAVRFLGYYLFGVWGSMRTDQLFSWLLMFWAPVLLFLLILATLLSAIFEGEGRKASRASLILYTVILLVITTLIWWVVTQLMMGFT